MADLAKTQSSAGARRRGSDNRDYTLPSRRQTDAANLEVNAQINGRSQSEAQQLSAILGLAEDAGQQAVGLLEQRDANIRDTQRTQGRLDDAQGSPNADALAKSRAYAQGYYTSGAQRTVIELSTKAAQAVNERLYNADDPATLDDVNEVLNGLFTSVAMNEDGTVRNFGDPAAARIMAEGLAKIRGEVLPKAAEYIRTRQNEQLASNVAFNLLNGGMPEIFQPSEMGPLRVPQPGDVTTVGTEPSAYAGGAAPKAAPAVAAAPTATPFQSLAAAVEFVESRGNPRAVSSKGARGRMQTMPDTLRDPGYGVRPAKDNSDAEMTRVGQEYLQAMLREYGGDPVLALAAYNAGPGRANDWRALLGTGSTEERIARIPFTETRNYVRNVLAKQAEAGGSVSSVEPGANEDPNLGDKLWKPSDVMAPPKVDFERVMALRPPSISPGEWKALMVPSIIAQAEDTGRPELLDGLWRATREDGTPSFNPEEIGTIRDAAERLYEKRRVQADRARREKWEANADVVITELLNDRDPSDTTLIKMANQGELDPSFAYTILEQRENEREADAREVRTEFREAEREAEAEIDYEVSGIEAERLSGVGAGTSFDEDMARFRAGEFGTGKKGLARFRRVRAATTQGIERVNASPDGQRYATLMEEAFPRARTTTTGGSMLERAMGQTSNANRTAAFSHYSSQIERGMSPREAYESATKTYGGSSGNAALQARRAELRSRQ